MDSKISLNVSSNIFRDTKKILVMSGKGGVGKSTVAVNIALTLAGKFPDKNIGLMDADLHGPNIPKMLGIEDIRLAVEEDKIIPYQYMPNFEVVSTAFFLPEKDSPLIWRGPLKIKLIKQLVHDTKWSKPSYMVVDLPPGTGDEALSSAQELSDVDMAVVVTTPQEVALLDARRTVNFARELQIKKIGVVENMSYLLCPHCGEKIYLFGEGGGKKMAEEMNVDFLGEVPMDPEIVKGGDEGNPAVIKGKEEIKKAFEIITGRMLEVMG